jgi:hypothetical protein
MTTDTKYNMAISKAGLLRRNGPNANPLASKEHSNITEKALSHLYNPDLSIHSDQARDLKASLSVCRRWRRIGLAFVANVQQQRHQNYTLELFSRLQISTPVVPLVELYPPSTLIEAHHFPYFHKKIIIDCLKQIKTAKLHEAKKNTLSPIPGLLQLIFPIVGSFRALSTIQKMHENRDSFLIKGKYDSDIFYHAFNFLNARYCKEAEHIALYAKNYSYIFLKIGHKYALTNHFKDALRIGRSLRSSSDTTTRDLTALFFDIATGLIKVKRFKTASEVVTNNISDPETKKLLISLIDQNNC